MENNREGYPDPTAEIAVTRVMAEEARKKMKEERGVNHGKHVKADKSNKNR